MSNVTFPVGTPVRCAGPGGSTGKVVGVRTDGPFVNDHGLYVEWVYGRDCKGEVMTAKSAFYGESKYELVRVTEAEYEAVRNRKGFG